MWTQVEIAAESTPVTVKDFLPKANERGLQLSLIAGAEGISQLIPEPLPYRPGLALTGFFDYFSPKRLQVIGMTEYCYLRHLSAEDRIKRVSALFESGIPCVAVTRNLEIFPEMKDLAERFKVPLLQSPVETKDFFHMSTFVLEGLQAPRRKVHGTMMEIDGVGVFIEGDAGVGKSETALGLIMRGHALVADDLTVFRRDGNGDIFGSACPITQNYMEIRGIGVINVPETFGLAAVRGDKKLELIVTLLQQSRQLDEGLDRTGMDELKRMVLGVPIPQRIISVAPGRDLVNIVITAARKQKQIKSGKNPAKVLDEQIKNYHMKKCGL